ncbi:MAG: hypothetical protein HND58_07505 [Planctomycetota bacterium]|nr:MAG: hypothetical protein HND58_07505 [Planctomycetota bacterium]
MQTRWRSQLVAVLALLTCTITTAWGSAQDARADVRSGDLEYRFEVGEPGDAAPQWMVPTPGWAAALTADAAAEGEQSMVLEQHAATDAPFGNVMRVFDAAPYRGKRVRLSAKVLAEGEPVGRAMMWLRARPERRHDGRV